MRADKDKSRQGSVLLETVLAIPLYVILLGGTMWLGELMLAKEKLVVADRYAAWNGGNRHRLDKGGIRSEIQDNFFNPDKVGDERVTNIRYEHGIKPPTLWNVPFGATVELRVMAPVWTEGWLAAGVTHEGTISVQNKVTLTGRDDEVVSDPSHHALMMRTLFGEFAYRVWQPKQIADRFVRPWKWERNVYKEDWAEMRLLHSASAGEMQEVSGLPNPPDANKYERHATYKRWSR